MSQPQQTQPWRKHPEWTEKFLEKLTEDIVSFKPSCELELSDIRILMLGPVGAGKSSFYNTINSVFKGRISDSAPCGVAPNGITVAFTPYEVKVRSGSSLNFRLCDTPGLEVTRGLDQLECNYLMDGNISDNYEFNPAAPITSYNPGFVHHPSITKQIHCVMFVIDAAEVDKLPSKLVERMHSFQRLANRKGIPQAVLLTKVDLACQDVASEIKSVFTSQNIEAAVDKTSDLLGLPRNHIIPVKNYEHEMELDANISILALLALRRLLYLAEDYTQVFQNKLKACTVSYEKLDKPESLEKGKDHE